MARPRSNTPTPGELEILQVFWKNQVCTVREVHQTLREHRPVATTTVASMMQLMHDKGLLKLIETRRPQRYEAAIGLDEARGALINEVAARVFDNSPKALVLHLLKSRDVGPERLAQAEKLMDGID